MTALALNDLLAKADIDREGVLVLRHRPREPDLRKVLPWLAAERTDLYNAYQQTRGPRLEAAMTRGRHIASFIGHEAGKAVFVGLYEIAGSRPLTFEEFWQVPAHRNELKAFGMQGFKGERAAILCFDLQLTGTFAEWKGKLIIDWPPPEIAWWRRANRNEFPVRAILFDSMLDEAMPDWRELVLTWDELAVLPTKWKEVLAQWRGIYLILDTSDGKGYVGSAYGRENILGRWRNYAETGHGGNRKLLARDPRRFRFSVLERLSPDQEIEDVIARENSWKMRLDTCERGLNDN